MKPSRLLVAAWGSGVWLVWAGLAGVPGPRDQEASKVLPPRLVSFQKSEIPLSKALAQIKEQTGISVIDRRLSRNDPKLVLAIARTPFWQALQAVAKAADARISPYQADGNLALTEGPYRPFPAVFHGPFQIAVKGLVLSQNLETDNRSCVVHLEVAWEPWFQPFYLDVGPATAVFAPDKNGKAIKAEIPSRGQHSIAGKLATEVEVRLPAPKRSSPGIDLLQGTFRVIGPSKMLTFTFPARKPIKNDPIRQEKEGVAVSLTKIAAKSDRWTFDVLIENPPGGPRFESYQSWLDNNQIYLEKGTGKDREVFFPDPAAEETLGNVTATRAAIRYHFTPRNGGRTMPGKLGDWKLVYRTPGRIVEVPVPFAFKGLDLP
jgi:hypothetical protein